MISIITPLYNGERFIESCIRVVIDQNCSDIEHIIVDGGSTDGSVEIIKEYARKYPHIRWISEKDRGQSDAMNKGIAMSEGEIIAILNVDDFYEVNVLNRIAQIFSTLPEPSLVVGNCRVWNDRNKILYVNKPRKLDLFDLLMGFKINPHPINPSAYFYHKSLHKIIGDYKVDEHYVMDLDFLLRAVRAAKLHYVNEIWGNYRYIEGTKTVNNVATGNHLKRYNELLNEYTRTLPIVKQIQIVALRNMPDNLRYFLKKPQEILPSLIDKISS